MLRARDCALDCARRISECGSGICRGGAAHRNGALRVSGPARRGVPRCSLCSENGSSMLRAVVVLAPVLKQPHDIRAALRLPLRAHWVSAKWVRTRHFRRRARARVALEGIGNALGLHRCRGLSDLHFLLRRGASALRANLLAHRLHLSRPRCHHLVVRRVKRAHSSCLHAVPSHVIRVVRRNGWRGRSARNCTLWCSCRLLPRQGVSFALLPQSMVLFVHCRWCRAVMSLAAVRAARQNRL